MRKSALTSLEGLPDGDARTFGGSLTPKQRKVAKLVGQGESWNSAAKKAGYASGSSNIAVWKTDPRMMSIVAAEQKKNELVADMSRKKVMDGFLEAIDIARIQADPTAMIKGWTEVAKMCGYYAPDTKKIDISISAKRLVDKFETMSDEELLKYAEKDIIDLVPIEHSSQETADEEVPSVPD